jgi:glycosyltransferase involved in cell wall biosynthesis
LIADVVIPTFNNATALERCLIGLATQTASEFRILVCVDGSTDRTLEMLAAIRHPAPLEVLVHADRQNHGRAAARNLGLPHLRGGAVIFLDSDLIPDSRFVEGHVRLLSRRDCVSLGEVRYDASSSTWARYLATRGRYRTTPGRDARVLDFAGANVAMMADHVLAVGGFDEALSAYGGEDTELGFRLWGKLGLSFVYNGDAVARTHESKSIKNGLAELREYGATNLREIRRRHPDMPPPFFSDRFDSPRLADRLFRLMLNHVSQRIASALVPRAPFVVQRRLLNYLVIGAIYDGYRAGPR